MDGKVCIVTGASTGIGRVTALELARQGAHVVLVCRNREKGESAIAEIQEKTGSTKTELLLCDMSSQKDIRRAAAEFLGKHDRLDVLVNNAGAINDKYEKTVDGLELTFATNHLGYFLFTELLLETLKKSSPARIVNVASDAHKAGKMNWDDLQLEKGFSGWAAYAQSKLANILFTFELARKLEGTGVTANCVHPGVVASGFGQNNKGIIKMFYSVAAPFLKSNEGGAKTQIYLASSPEVEGVSGKYFANIKPLNPSARARSNEDAKRLWDVSEKLTR